MFFLIGNVQRCKQFILKKYESENKVFNLREYNTLLSINESEFAPFPTKYLHKFKSPFAAAKCNGVRPKLLQALILFEFI